MISSVLILLRPAWGWVWWWGGFRGVCRENWQSIMSFLGPRPMSPPFRQNPRKENKMWIWVEKELKYRWKCIWVEIQIGLEGDCNVSVIERGRCMLNADTNTNTNTNANTNTDDWLAWEFVVSVCSREEDVCRQSVSQLPARLTRY